MTRDRVETSRVIILKQMVIFFNKIIFFFLNPSSDYV